MMSSSAILRILQRAFRGSSRLPHIKTMKPERIRLFVKSYCGWCHEAEDWLNERGFIFECLNVTADPAARKEMVALSGQTRAPVIEVSGQVLADFDTDQLMDFWKRFE